MAIICVKEPKQIYQKHTHTHTHMCVQWCEQRSLGSMIQGDRGSLSWVPLVVHFPQVPPGFWCLCMREEVFKPNREAECFPDSALMAGSPLRVLTGLPMSLGISFLHLETLGDWTAPTGNHTTTNSPHQTESVCMPVARESLPQAKTR